MALSQVRFVFLSLALLAAPATFGTSFVIPTDSELIAKSEAIVQGRVEGSSVRVAGNRVETIFNVRVRRALKGGLRTDELIRVATPGGAIGDLTLVVDGAARFTMGEELVLFLQSERGQWYPTDMTLGKFRVTETVEAERVLVRDVDDVVMVEPSGTQLRSADAFLHYVEKAIAGSNGPADYLIDSPSAELRPSEFEENFSFYLPQSYTSVCGGGSGYRLLNPFDSYGKQEEQNIPGAGDGGASAIQSALAAWDNDPGSSIGLTYSGPVSNRARADGVAPGVDLVNVIEFNDPQGLIGGTWTGSGVIATTYIVARTTDGGDGKVDGWCEIVDSDIVFQDGYTANQAAFNTALTHEVGHSIGFRHSNGPPSEPNSSSQNCNPATEDCTTGAAAIMYYAAVPAFGFTLRPWDINAVRAVYPQGAIAVKNDVNGDGRADVLWRNAAASLNALWFMNGSTIGSSTFTTMLDASWTLAGRGDFNNDGRMDILWRQLDSGIVAVWLMNGASILASGFLPSLDSSWTVAAVGNLDAAVGADIVWRNSSGRLAIWLLDGVFIRGSGFLDGLDASWSIGATADFNGDGTSDLLLRRSTGANQIALFTLSGSDLLVNSFTIPTLDTSWSSVGAGDFNRDGRGDILWRNASGVNAMWFMNGSSLSSSAFIPALDPAWQVVATSDFDGDTDTDIMWSLNGGIAVWLMNGATIESSAFGPTLDSGWSAKPGAATDGQ